MIMELLLWAELLSENAKVLAAVSESNFVLIAYALVALLTNKSRFLLAFILCEIYGNLTFFDTISDVAFYLGYAVIYCLLYFWCTLKHTPLKTQLSCIVMVLFELTVGMDALINQTETFIFTNYVGFVVLIHFYIISSLIDWRAFRIRLGESINALFTFFRINDGVSFFCYNIKKALNK